MKEKLIELIRIGDLEGAFKEGGDFLNLMKDYYYGWTTLQSRYNDVKKNNNKGILSHQDFNNQINRINAELLDLIIKLDEDVNSNLNKVRPKEQSFKDKLQTTLMSSYEILESISEGTSTVTFKAKELFDDNFVAIRALKNDNLFNHTEAFDEVSRIKRINHRNIISVIGKSDIHTSPKYVIMEYVSGIDLERLIIENGPRPISETKRILFRICDALYYLHKRKIFNSDLRASRILIDEEGEPMISPFIVFRTKSETSYNQIISNLKYMSYQRLNSKDYKHFTPQSNQFSLGVIAYLLLVGEPLFDIESMIDLIEARNLFEKDKTYREEKLSKIEGSKKVVHLVKKLLSKERHNRFDSMFEILTYLNDIEDDSHEHHRIAQESYSRACSYNPKITFELVERINNEEFDNFPELNRNEFAMKLHHIISLIIETSSDRGYLFKVIKSKKLSYIFFHYEADFKDILFTLLKENDYLWSKEVKKAWTTTLDETFQRVKMKYTPNLVKKKEQLSDHQLPK